MKKMPTTRNASMADDIVLSSTLFYLMMLSLTWVGFIVGCPITAYHLAVSGIVVAGVLSFMGNRRGRLSTALYAVAIAAGSVAIAAFAASRVLDLSWDGMSYHQVSIIAFVSGWNPLSSPGVLDWWLHAYPERAWLASVADDGIWTDHYPKASWILGAVMSAATGSLNTAKWLQPHIALVAILATYSSMTLFTVSRVVAALIAVTATLSPVVVAQLQTNYIDGVLGSALLIQISAMLAWHSRRSASDLLVSLAACIVAVNLKFTGAVYAPLIFSAMFLYISFTGARFLRSEMTVIAIGAVIAILVSFQTYLGNTIGHGNPFYPLSQVDMAAQGSEAFISSDRWTKFLHSTFFQNPSRDVATLGPVSLTVPRAWHYWLAASSYDLRIAGFGTLFGWSFLFSVGSVAYCLWFRARYAWRNGSVDLLLVAMVAIVGSVIINPEFWWARYVPHLWFIPFLVSVLCASLGRPLLSMANLAPAAGGSVLAIVFWLMMALGSAQQNGVFAETWNARSGTGQVRVLSGVNNDWGLFTFWHQMRDLNIDAVLVHQGDECRTVGMVSVCSK